MFECNTHKVTRRTPIGIAYALIMAMRRDETPTVKEETILLPETNLLLGGSGQGNFAIPRVATQNIKIGSIWS